MKEQENPELEIRISDDKSKEAPDEWEEIAQVKIRFEKPNRILIDEKSSFDLFMILRGWRRG